ncbi:hypothetical protein COJ01_18150 [Priestia megaterium]|jgi:hypothetical protein|uniref:hypothetical protein n=1 Tax=Priestia megaterium TaxID=1404 RepID=UPI000BF4D51F|nr:hypothetical protein [Priestia megaterium]PFK99967.1 hypothetical protein COJ01_18150 [Priestia megaterium]
MYQGNGYLLATSVVLIVGLFIVWILCLIPSVDTPRNNKVKSQKFERLNRVEGILTVDDKQIPTFNVGHLTLDETITIKFYNNLGKKVQVTDIMLNEQSMFAFAPLGSWRDKADFAVQVLKHNAHSGTISMDLADEVSNILIDVENLNEYIEEGKVTQKQNEDYVWVY